MNLAIQGHATRGREVIEILEMLGGVNNKCLHGVTIGLYYFIDYKEICSCESVPDTYIIFTLEEFEEKFQYKVGDKVIYEDKIRKITKMVWEGQTNTVAYKLDDKLYCNVINKLQPYKEQETMKKEILPHFLTVYDSEENKHEIVATDGYEIKEENGKYYAVKKKPKYPSSYKECAELLNTFCGSTEGHKGILLVYFQQLLICRDAYWKIAGEQMGLGKPWKPDYNEESYEQGSPIKYVIYYTGTYITKGVKCTPSHILAFPTEEIRDVFFENFKELIERCKELL